MIDFSTLQGLTIPEGVVTQIADASGRVLWSAGGKPVVLQVEKMSFTSYAGETSYSDKCVLLDIYPKTASSTVKITYGGLTKALSFSGINARQIYFGTFNGVADETETPDSGTLTIEGGYTAFGCSAYQSGSKTTAKTYCNCITAVTEWGSVTNIPAYAFQNCLSLAVTPLPSGITSIGNYAFHNCTNLALTSLPSGITSIGESVFSGCTNLALTSLPSGITSISDGAFIGCLNLALTSLPNSLIRIGNYAFQNCRKIAITEIPHGVTSIGESAFYNLSSDLTVVSTPLMYGRTMTLPETLQSIGTDAFVFHVRTGNGNNTYYNLFSDSTVTILSATPPSITGETTRPFGSAYSKSDRFIVPKGSLAAYETADGWSGYVANCTVVEAS